MPGWDLTAVWTPGHSPGHLCFWEPANQLMLTGDCVLPRITPNVNLNPQTGDDPLGDYLRSLERLGKYDAEGLPAHEWRFPSLRDRTMRTRANTTNSASWKSSRRSVDGYDTAWEITPQMEWSRPWDDVDKFTRRAAIGEAMAHLRTLEVQGIVRGDPRRTVALGAPRRLKSGSRWGAFPFAIEHRRITPLRYACTWGGMSWQFDVRATVLDSWWLWSRSPRGSAHS